MILQVVSATPALVEETKVEPIKAEETTTEEVATPPPPPPPAAEPEKETDTTVTPEEPVALENQAPVAPEPVQEEKVEALELASVLEIEAKPEPESESVNEALKDEVGGIEEKPAEGEEEIGKEAPVEKTED
ncbi:hypothetical protein Acr_17g0007990 [Actinidia rufa]|uniref:Uncharacterized protein n=1 Tax=Actinidia rufa TaxID=165716 RepID=A0A7J0G373_9ERIC|nr:hypothetical protein Acr_17g0007990 [Actinidia rufa]